MLLVADYYSNYYDSLATIYGFVCNSANNSVLADVQDELVRSEKPGLESASRMTVQDQGMMGDWALMNTLTVQIEDQNPRS